MRDIAVRLSSRYIFSFLIIAALVVIISCSVMGYSQDQLFLQDRVKLSQAQKYLSEGNAVQAGSIFLELLTEYPDSAPLLKYYGDSLVGQGDYQESVAYYRRAQEEYPFIVKEGGFSLNMGESLFHTGDYRDAAKYLQIAKFIATAAEDKEKIDQLLSDITYEG